MRTLKYIMVGVLMISLSLSSMTHLLGQKSSIEFLETYSYAEITSNLDPGDRFFQLMEQQQPDPKSAHLGLCPEENIQDVWNYIQSKSFRSRIPSDARFAWGVREDDGSQALYGLKQTGKEFEGPDQWDLKNVAIQKDNNRGNLGLLITFSDQGAIKWETLTGKNVGRNIAILIEGRVYMAPTVREKIKEGKCLISGNFSESEISRIKELLERKSG